MSRPIPPRGGAHTPPTPPVGAEGHHGGEGNASARAPPCLPRRPVDLGGESLGRPVGGRRRRALPKVPTGEGVEGRGS
jgi:hypothetical protein